MSETIKLRVGDEAPDFTVGDVSRRDTFSLSDYKGKLNVVLIFLRYAGCPLCQLAIADLSKRFPEFAAKDTDMIVFVQSRVSTLVEQRYPGRLPFRLVADPDGDIYAKYGVGAGNFIHMVKGRTIGKAFKATMRGYKQGKMEGNQFQLPGDFIVGKDGRIKLAHVGSDISDNLKPDTLLRNL